MNVIDIIVCAILVIAVYNGWKSGVIVQTCSLAGILIGIYLASEYGTDIGVMLRLEGQPAVVIGFIVVLLGTMVVVTLVSYAIRKLFRFAGLGVLDIALGIVVSIIKYALILSVAFSAFDTLNRGFEMVDKQILNNSIFYKPIMKISVVAFDLFDEIEEHIPVDEIKDAVTENIV